MGDTALLLVAVNGFALAVLITGGVLFLPASGALIAGGIQNLSVRLSPSSATTKLQHRLDLAGNPRGWTVERVFTVKGVIALGVGFALAMLCLSMEVLFSVKGLFLVSLFSVAGFFIPNALLYSKGARRQEQIQKELPDVLDLMSVSMRAGLSFDGAMSKVTMAGDGALAAEFGRVLQELRLGRARTSVLRDLLNRTNVDDLHYVVQALIQASDLGIPVADVLTSQGAEMRVRRKQRAEEKAQKVTIKILFPTLFCIFPVIMIVVIVPALISIVEKLVFRGTGG
jgi:tight adherence protein C